MSERIFEAWVRPLFDLFGFGRARGWVTVDEIDAVLAPSAARSGVFKDLMTALNGLGIDVLDRPGGIPLARPSSPARRRSGSREGRDGLQA